MKTLKVEEVYLMEYETFEDVVSSLPTFTANQPFEEWDKIFTDKTMTLAAIDRLVHHAAILEMNVESYRCKAALKRKRGKVCPRSPAAWRVFLKNRILLKIAQGKAV